MKRKSFLIIIVFLFWVGYIALTIGQTLYNNAAFQDETVKQRLKQVDHLLSVSQTLVIADQMDALRAHLDEAVDYQFINYYCVRKKDDLVYERSVGKVSGCDATYDRRIASFGEVQKYPDQINRPIKVDDTIVSVGFANDFWSFFLESQKFYLNSYLKDIFIITVFLAFLVYLIMKDFLTLDRLLQKGDKLGLSRMKARSKEAQTLIDSTYTLNQMNNEKSDIIHHLQNTVGLAIHSEIDNKTPHLTLIPTAVVRIDLNGYTQIFLEKKEEHIVGVLNEYFSVTNDLIKRFDGEIYQIIGDEIIFVLKNKNPLHALFCVRAIFEWAHELDKKILKEHGHRFLLKASISYGPLRFIQLNNGYAFAGVPLIESVRLLGCVSDKSENTLIINKDGAEAALEFLKNQSSKEVGLKGFDDKSEVLEIKEFISLEEFFSRVTSLARETDQKSAIKSLTYFRSQNDIISSLELLNDTLHSKNWGESFHLIQHLKEIKLGIKSEIIANHLFRIMSDHFQLINTNAKEYSFLNSLILITESLVHMNLWNDHWEKLMRNYLLSSQPRIVANATEVLCYFGYDSEEMQKILSNWKGNNRISANFLLSEMKKSIDKTNVRTILSWLDSEHILFQVSALYVIEETLRYYRSEDPVVFRTNTLLADCVTAADKHRHSDNPLIKSRYEKLQMIAVSHAALELKLQTG